MPDSIHEFLVDQPVALLFLVLGFGYAVGKTRIKGYELGAVTGVLFVGLFFGHFQLQISPAVQSLGFMLFIFSVGFEAGPRFFAILQRDGKRYLSLAVVISLTGFGAAVAATKLLGFELGAAAGILAGGLTSSPTLAAAQEAVRGGMVPLPDGTTADAVMTNITTAYAITYIFGLVGLILIIRLLPRIAGFDLRAEAKRLETTETAGLDDSVKPLGNVVARAYRVTNADFTGAPIGELVQRLPGRATIEKLRRAGEWVPVDDDTVLEIGDEVAVVGFLERLVPSGGDVLGPELTDSSLIESVIESCRIVVTQRRVKGAPVDPRRVIHRFGCFVAHLQRQGVEVPLGGDVRLMPGDVIHVTGTPRRLDELGRQIGHVERNVQQTDLITLGLGIAAGSFVGALSVRIGGVPIGLGSAGGLLAAGLVVGYLRALHPTFGRIPEAARWVFMEMGLLMFMAGVGLRAGSNILETLASAGPRLFLAGIMVTVLPVSVGYVFGRRVLKLNPVLLLGGVTGSMTSGACLSLVIREAESSMPALGYTGAYAFANILLTIAGSIILLM